MATFTYSSASIHSWDAVWGALVSRGVIDATVTLNGDVKITTEAAESVCDAAIADATTGSLFSSKLDRKKTVSDKSSDLAAIGIDTWVPAKSIQVTKQAVDDHRSTLKYYQENPSKLSAATPYIVFVDDGTAVTTATLSDIETLVNDLADRLIYIYSNAITGEAGLLAAIDLAETFSELNAINDSRS